MPLSHADSGERIWDYQIKGVDSGNCKLLRFTVSPEAIGSWDWLKLYQKGSFVDKSDEISPPAIHCDLLILSLNCPEHLNVNTCLAARIMSSPVAGFRSLLSRFFLTQNFPNPLMRTSYPNSVPQLAITACMVGVSCFTSTAL